MCSPISCPYLDDDNWIIQESTPDLEKLEATRNGHIQIGWIRNTVPESFVNTEVAGYKVHLMLELCISGSATITFDNHSQIFVPQHCLHLSNPYNRISSISYTAGVHEYYHIIIPAIFYDALLQFGIIQPNTFIYPIPQGFQWKERLTSLAEELMACPPHKLPSFVSTLYGEICDVLTRPISPEAISFADTMRQIADILSHDHHQRLSLPQIAERFHMTLRTMERRFTDTFGLSPKQFRIARRMELASRLLQNSPHPKISQIAATLGYSSPFAFSKHFKDIHGVSPSEYIHR